MKFWLDKLNKMTANSQTVDRRLRRQLPKTEPTPQLHEDIMHAVRSASRMPASQRQFSIRNMIPVTGVALLVLFAALLANHFFSGVSKDANSHAAPTLAAAGSALEFSNTLVKDAPVAALSPLYDEAQSLDRDLANTGQFLLASMP